jgi:site-specific DNA recombinase
LRGGDPSTKFFPWKFNAGKRGGNSMKAVGYIRVSTPTQATEGESLKTQREAIGKYAKDKGLELAKIYADEGVSGAKKDRPALMELISDAKERKFDRLIVHRLSRFGRNARDLLNNVECLKENEIQFVSLKESIDLSDAYGRFMFQMLGAMAELEREMIREQMAENKIARWREGRIIVGTLPFGYTWDKEKKGIEIVKEEEDIFRRIVDMYLNQGTSFDDIAAQLTREGIKSRRSFFRSSTISGILKNPAYYGNYTVNTVKYDGKKKTGEAKPASEHIRFDIPTIITKTQWDRIQEKTAFNKHKGKRVTIADEYWLRDILQCGMCAGRIKPKHGQKRKDGSRLRYYRCYWSGTSEKELRNNGRKRCSLPYIKAEELESYVWNELVTRMFVFEDLKTSMESLGKVGKKRKSWFDELADPDRYDREISKLEKRKGLLNKELQRKELARERLYQALEKDRFLEQDFLEKQAEFKNEMLRIEGQLSEIAEKLQAVQQAKANDRRIHDFLRNKRGMLQGLYKELDNLSSQDKKVYIEGMIDGNVEVGRGASEEDGPWTLHIWPRLNPSVIERLIREGKVVSLNKDASDHSSGHEL